MTRLVFELAYFETAVLYFSLYNAAVQHLSQYVLGYSPCLKFRIKMKLCVRRNNLYNKMMILSRVPCLMFILDIFCIAIYLFFC